MSIETPGKIFGNGKSTVPSMLKDPFSVSCIDSMIIWVRFKPASYQRTFRAVIHFVNGSTAGEHEIESDDWESMMAEIQATIEGIER